MRHRLREIEKRRVADIAGDVEAALSVQSEPTRAERVAELVLACHGAVDAFEKDFEVTRGLRKKALK